MSTNLAEARERRSLLAAPRDVCQALDLSDAGRDALTGDPAPQVFLDRLVAARCHDDAVNYLAHALPRVHAVRWACQSVRAAFGDALRPVASTAVIAAERWVMAPGEQHALAAAGAAESAGMKDEGAARFAALAAAWSGESLVAQDLPPVPAARELGAAAVAAAVQLAAVEGAPDQIDERLYKSIVRAMAAIA